MAMQRIRLALFSCIPLSHLEVEWPVRPFHQSLPLASLHSISQVMPTRSRSSPELISLHVLCLPLTQHLTLIMLHSASRCPLGNLQAKDHVPA